MASNKIIQKLSMGEAIVHFVNDSVTPVTFTIALTELDRPDQTIVGTRTATISDMVYSLDSGAEAKITRNGVLLYCLYSSEAWPNSYGVLATQSDQTISVTLGKGSLQMRLLKGPAFHTTVNT